MGCRVFRWRLLAWVGALAWLSGAALGAEGAAGTPGVLAEGEPALDVPKVPSLNSLLWNVDVSVRSWAGYKDNPQLSAVNPLGSALVAVGGDVVVSRLPADGRELTIYGMVEHVEYLTSGFEPETMAIVHVRGRQDLGSGWFVGGTAEYLYFRQVFDASDITGVSAVLRAEGHMASLKPSVGYEWGRGWRVEWEGDGSRQWLAEPLDSYWDAGAKFVATREFGKNESLAWSYRFRERMFDDRSRVDVSGAAISGTLHFEQHEVEAVWKKAWDEQRHWRSSVRLGWLENLDNGGGYYDYHRVQGALSLRYVRSRWEFKGEVRTRGYWYLLQPVAGAGSDERRRFDVGWLLRGQVTLWKGLRAFGQYEFDSSDENAVATDYHVNSVWLGLEFER